MMENTNNDFNSNDLLKEMLDEVVKRREDVAMLKAKIKSSQEELDSYIEAFIATILESGMKSFKTDMGVSASVVETVTYSVNKEDRPRFHKWLKTQGYWETNLMPMINHQAMQGFFRKDYEDEVPDFVNKFKKKGISIRGAK